MKRHSFFEFDNIALDLFFCSEILKLESLHYGLWDDAEAAQLTLDNLRRAQRRYTERLLEQIPTGTRSILDVGCGLGDAAKALAARGYEVTAISPDDNHRRYLLAAPPLVRFVQARYQTFRSPQKFDLILMSESQNYFQPQECFRQSSRYLNAGGHLLVSGMFRKKNGAPYPDFVNVLDDFLAHAVAAGFRLLSDIDVTRAVLPTLELVHGAVKAYAEPSLGLLRLFMSASAPLKTKVLGWALRKQLRELGAIRKYLVEKTDPATFEKMASYRMLLFGGPVD